MARLATCLRGSFHLWLPLWQMGKLRPGNKFPSTYFALQTGWLGSPAHSRTAALALGATQVAPSEGPSNQAELIAGLCVSFLAPAVYLSSFINSLSTWLRTGGGLDKQELRALCWDQDRVWLCHPALGRGPVCGHLRQAPTAASSPLVQLGICKWPWT